MKSNLRSLMACCAVGMLIAFGAAPAAASCNANGVVDGGEECDGGPELYINGDPENDPCTGGSTCYFKNTCCKFNCQFVGTPGVPCENGDNCSGPDTCNQVGACVGGNQDAVDGTPCDDGQFCTGAETCQSGVCSSAGDPCSGAACQHCNETADNCFDADGSSCSFEGDTCVIGGTCDGAGACVGGVFSTGNCDDGEFCNGTDTCEGGACHIHSGDPCPGTDGDANCSESCDEDAGNCSGADLDGTNCNDGLFCDGDGNVDVCTAGACVGNGTPECDDDNSCTTDLCDDTLDACLANVVALDGTPCDDEAVCSLNDQCQGGVCVGDESITGDLCPWTILIRENEKKDRIKTGFSAVISGDMCGGTLQLGGKTNVTSDIVADEATGTGQLRIAPDAIIGDDIVSGGGGAKAFPGSGNLPYVLPLSSTLAPGTVQAKNGATGTYDLSGLHALETDCHAARTSYSATTAALDALTATQTDTIKLSPTTTKTITANVAGGLNVVDVDGGLSMSPDSILELNGAGNSDSVMILRLNGKMKMSLRTTVSLTNGLTPDHTMIYVKGKKCQISDLALGAGTVLCSPGRVKTGRVIVWLGTIYSDGKLMKIGDKSNFSYNPFTGL